MNKDKFYWTTLYLLSFGLQRFRMMKTEQKSENEDEAFSELKEKQTKSQFFQNKNSGLAPFPTLPHDKWDAHLELIVE